MDDLISRSKAIEAMLKQPNTPTPSVIRRVLRQVPGVDAVSRAVVEQIQWERDIAIEQLKDHGIPFGGIAPDVVKVARCKDCIHYEMGACLKIYSDGAVSEYAWQERKPDDFCSYGKRREENATG